MPTDRIMPIELQIVVIRRNVKTLNPSLSDPDVIPISETEDDLWEDYIDPSASLPENIASLERRFPHIRWRAPKKEPSIIREEREWETEYIRKDDIVIHTKTITIRPHKVTAKGKTYRHGRIQLTVPQKWVGSKAKITVRVPTRKAIPPKKPKHFEL